MTDADGNVAIGRGSLSTDTLGSTSVAIGQDALNGQNFTTATNTQNVAVGFSAGLVNSTGMFNTFLGNYSGSAQTTADNNTFVGTFVADSMTTGHANVAVGGGSSFAALGTDTKGKFSTAIGFGALTAQNFTTDTQTNNTAVGYFAGGVNTTGTGNTYVGSLAGDDSNDGNNNTAVGHNALGANAQDQNTAVGRNSLLVSTGSGNVAVGDGAGESATSAIDCIFIGHDAGSGQVTTTNDQLYIARSNAALGNDPVYLYGGSNGALINGDNSSTFNTVSDERIKKNIVDSPKGLAEILQVKIRNFEYRTFDELDDNVKALNDGKGLNVLNKSGVKTGVIAQELETIFPNDVIELPDGTKNVKIENTQWALIKAVQELSAKNDALEARIATLEG